MRFIPQPFSQSNLRNLPLLLAASRSSVASSLFELSEIYQNSSADFSVAQMMKIGEISARIHDFHPQVPASANRAFVAWPCSCADQS